MPPTPLDNVPFNAEENVIKWKHVYRRKIYPERELFEEAQNIGEIIELLSDAQLLKIVIGIGSYYPKLVNEFIVNLPSGFNMSDSPNFKKVFVRSHCFNISPAVINDYLGRGRIVNADCPPSMKTIVHELSEDDKKD